MLTDNQLKGTIDEITNLYEKVEDDILRKLVKFIDNNEELGGSAQWYTKKLGEISDLNGDLVRTLAKYSIKTETVIRSMLEKAVLANFSDDGVLGVTKEKLLENSKIRDQIDYFANDLGRNMAKIRTNTINLTKQEYLQIVDKATLETSLGVKSFSESINESLKDLGDRGITAQLYERKDGTIVKYNIEGLVRRDAITSVFGIANRAMLEIAKDTGNLVYVSQHFGARTSPISKIANHAGWQGKMYMLEGSNEKYGNFYTETGAGTVEGFGGVNCRHRVVSAYEGMKIPEELDLEKNAEIENKEKHQRYLEHGVRAWKRKELIFKASGNEEEYKKAHLKVEEWSNKLDQFTKDNGLRRDYVRERLSDTQSKIDESKFRKIVKSDNPTVTWGSKYDVDIHKEEIITANWLKETFNTKIDLFSEINNQKNIDAKLGDKMFCEIKNVSSNRSIESQIRLGKNQLMSIDYENSPTAMLLNVTEDRTMYDVCKQVIRQHHNHVKFNMFYIIKIKGDYKILYLKKKN